MRSGDNHKAVPHPDRRYARHLLHPGAEPEGRNGTGEGVFLLGSRVLFCSEENKWSRASCQGIHNPQHDFFPADPVFFSIEHFIFPGEQINTKIILVAQIAGIGLAAAGAAGSTAKLSTILIQRRNFVKKSIYG